MSGRFYYTGMTNNQIQQVYMLMAFDCDGTLDISKGPIPIERLRQLDIPPCSKVVIVSSSDKCSQLPFPRIIGGSRTNNLIMASNMFPSIIKVYVSDNPGDNVNAKNAGYTYIHPLNFI